MRSKRTAAWALAVMVLAGCGTSHAKAGSTSAATTTKAAETITIEGKVTAAAEISLKKSIEEGSDCVLRPGFDDLPGAQLVVADDSGKTLATADLGPSIYGAAGSSAFQCEMHFSVPLVDKLPGFYTITVGHRGSLKYSAEQLAEPLVLTMK